MRCTLLVLGSLLFASTARAESAQDLWAEATARMAQGQEGEAIFVLEQLLQEHPGDVLSDDALFLKATLLEEKLGKPAEARDAYERLLRDYPDSRVALAAQRRLQSLRQSLGPGDRGAEALAAFQDLLHRYPERGEAASLALATRLLKEHSSWAGSYRIRLWIAETNRRLGYLGRAAPHFEQVRVSDAPASARVQASLGAIDVEILRGDFAKANQLLDALVTETTMSASESQAAYELRDRAKLAASRARWVWASYLLLACMLLLLLVAARRANTGWREFWMQLRAPPVEVIYMVPVALLLTAMAFTSHQEIGPAVAIISGGGLLVSWLAANALRGSKRLRLGRALFCTSAATIAALCLCYLALHRGQLLDLLNTTLAFGPE